MISIPLPPLLKLRVAVAWECLKQDATLLAHARHVPSRLPDSKVILDTIRRDGLHVLRGFYPRAVCAQLVGVIDALVAAYPERLEVDEEGADHRIWGSERAAPPFRAFFDDPVLESWAAAYLGTRVANITTMGAKLVALPDNRGSGGGWHRDSMFEKQFKAILYLTDVSAENGPFQYLVGSNTRSSVLRTLAYTRGQRNLKRYGDDVIAAFCRADPGKLKTVTGAAGDVILVDTRGIHRGCPIAEGSRYALTNYYTARHRYGVHFPGFRPLVKF
jgi:hypothetical protein